MREHLESGRTLSLRLGDNNMIDLRTNLNLTELKQRLTDLLIRSCSCMEALAVHGNLRYIGSLYGPNFSLAENCRHPYSIVLVIASIFQQSLFFINSSSSASLQSGYVYHPGGINKWTAAIHSGSIIYKEYTNWNCLSKSNSILQSFLLTLLDHQKKTPLPLPTLLAYSIF